MKKIINIIIICFLFSSAHAQQIIEGLIAPESVLKVGDKIFVSNKGGGSISELSSDGKFIHKTFQKGILHSPKGLAAIGNTIYVTDTSRVVGFDMNTGEQVFELFVPAATFLNDLCVTGENQLAVTDSRSGNINEIDISNKMIHFLGSIAGANGVTYDKKTKLIYACGMGIQMNGEGKLYMKDITKNDTVFYEMKNSPTGKFDGIELMDDDHLIVDDWTHNGRVFIYNLKDNSSVSYTVNCSTADLYFDKSTGDIYIPDMMKNRIVIMNVKTLK